ncbi:MULTISPECIES: winged helix-turn-helix domain-containing protein [Haloprofundus]|uniref:winged helix-turn-helix domain-containing protein n=1 Tax=Haloprofundus TaxID=1911573 RepID=UPI000E4469C1|nr:MULTISPECIES: helix-turn-helix domain-containing protein [Haloprofundus]QCJ46721.1 helix-turn-helix transcriptional regulator [Haloprofundus sp. MHR1]
MVRKQLESARAAPLQEVLDALDDPDCRTIVRQLDDAMTARQLSDACDIPLSTMYRKLERLTDASLLDEQTEIRSDGHHTTWYRVSFQSVEIGLDESRQFEVVITRRPQSADERLADLWSQVRRET